MLHYADFLALISPSEFSTADVDTKLSDFLPAGVGEKDDTTATTSNPSVDILNDIRQVSLSSLYSYRLALLSYPSRTLSYHLLSTFEDSN